MTNSEAIRIINQYDCNFYWTDGEKIPTEDLIEAFELAVKALDATEPRVLTLEEANAALQKDDVIWVEVEDGHMFGGIRKEDYFEIQNGGLVDFDDLMEPEIANKYGKVCRMWSAKPTDGQREATPWME